MSAYIKQTMPIRVPTVDGKTIEEHFGLISSKHNRFSVAHMVAPPGWSEPPQHPEFDEITIMISGRKRAVVDGEVVELSAGETLLVLQGAHVQYANPFNEPAEYWSICIPAFSPDTVHRED